MVRPPYIQLTWVSPYSLAWIQSPFILVYWIDSNQSLWDGRDFFLVKLESYNFSRILSRITPFMLLAFINSPINSSSRLKAFNIFFYGRAQRLRVICILFLGIRYVYLRSLGDWLLEKSKILKMLYLISNYGNVWWNIMNGISFFIVNIFIILIILISFFMSIRLF